MSRYFEDNQFPPNSRSLCGRDGIRYTGIVWKRPSELIYQPEFIVDGATSHDLDQGALGNCWFLAAAAALATQHPDRFRQVVPLDQTFRFPNYTGKFVFNFCWQGTWIEVEIDDYIPTDGAKPIYCSNVQRPNEFWPCLLEKAYAKLHGSYEALNGGRIVDALVDLTGGYSEVIDLRGKTRGSPQLFGLLNFFNRPKAVMGAGIFGEQPRSSELLNGLESGHAYSITGFYQVTLWGENVNLIRLRNPWGRGEWKGPWSDESREMNALPLSDKQALLFEIQDDGEFWMDFDDFITKFDEINICKI